MGAARAYRRKNTTEIRAKPITHPRHKSRETHHPIPNKLSHNLGDFSFCSHHFSASPGASARQA